MESNLILLFILVFPAVCSFIGFLIGIKKEKYRDTFNIIITGINFVVVTMLYRSVSIQPLDISINYIMGTGLHLRLDVFRYIFLWITSLVWFLVTIYSTYYLIRDKNRNRYYFFFMLTLCSTIGIFISENFINLFTFFEIMSFTSYALIIHDEDDYSHDAGYTYIVMAVTGGLILLMGLFLLFNYTRTLEISELYFAVKDMGSVKYVISTLIIIGFGIKAGMVPLHIWMPKVYPAAPAPASAILSGILAKTGIFGIILTIDIMLREDLYVSVIILVIGFLNMFLGGLLAMFQRNVKRILAYSSMSQIGYILVGIGLIGILREHNSIAIYGTLFHVINHSLFKVLLFMGAGCVYMILHELSINEIGGFGRKRTALKIIFLIGLFAIVGMPGFNGFASKTLLHEALSEANLIYNSKLLAASEVIFTLSSSFTTAYLLKIFAAVFIEKSGHNFDNVNSKVNKGVLIPMMVLSGLIIYIGLRPDIVMNVLGESLKTFGDVQYIEVHFYSLEAIKSSITTIFFGCIIYFFFVRKVLRKGSGTSWYYINPALKWFNIENNVYKPIGRALFDLSFILFRFIDGALVGTASFASRKLEMIGQLEVEYAKNIIYSIKKEINFAVNSTGKSDNTKQNIKTRYSINEMIGNLIFKMNSVTYSIFIFAVVLVVSLLFLIY